MRMRKKPKFVVQTSDGSHIAFYPSVKVKAYTDGLVVFYQNADGRLDMVGFNRKYRPLEQEGVFYIGKNIGNDSAAPLITLHRDDEKVEAPGAADIVGASTDPNCPGDDLSEIMRANLYSLALESISEEKTINKKLIIIIIIAVAVIFFLVKSGVIQKLFGG